MKAFLYILRLQSGGLYIGCTKDLETRYKDHRNGRACRTTRIDPPLSVVYKESHLTFHEARQREAQIKSWSRAKKEALIAGDIEKLKALSKTHQ
jgi:putative endonuclease